MHSAWGKRVNRFCVGEDSCSSQTMKESNAEKPINQFGRRGVDRLFPSQVMYSTKVTFLSYRLRPFSKAAGICVGL